MAKRVTAEEIVEMHRLYAKYGNYAEVGRKIGRSGSTVAKYINLKDRHTFARKYLVDCGGDAFTLQLKRSKNNN